MLIYEMLFAIVSVVNAQNTYLDFPNGHSSICSDSDSGNCTTEGENFVQNWSFEEGNIDWKSNYWGHLTQDDDGVWKSANGYALEI